MRRKSVSPGLRPPPAKKRAAATAERDAAILKAALQEFTEKGFVTARMDDIARRAGVAKGTVYLRFEDKEALFEAIVRQHISPVVNAAATALEPGESVRAFLNRMVVPFLHDLDGSQRGAVIRLLIAEAARFPKLAELYFRTVIEPGMAIFGSLARRALKTGELSDPAVARYPQLLIAPAVVGLLWSGMFGRYRRLDAEGMMRAHLDLLFRTKEE
jgi:AcrR family transcriptional regulator